MKVVPVTIVALAPTNGHVETLLTWRDPARPEACNAPSTMCQRSWMRSVSRPAAKGFAQQFAVELDPPILDELERLAFVTKAVGSETIGAASPKKSSTCPATGAHSTAFAAASYPSRRLNRSEGRVWGNSTRSGRPRAMAQLRTKAGIPGLPSEPTLTPRGAVACDCVRLRLIASRYRWLRTATATARQSESRARDLLPLPDARHAAHDRLP